MTASDFVTAYRQAVKDLYNARDRLKVLIERNSSTGIVGVLPDGPIGPIDPATGNPVGLNTDITKADLVVAMQAAGELESHLTDYTANPNVPTPTNMALQKLL